MSQIMFSLLKILRWYPLLRVKIKVGTMASKTLCDLCSLSCYFLTSSPLTCLLIHTAPANLISLNASHMPASELASLFA